MSGEVPGVDLARVALRAALEAARKNGGGRTVKAKPRTTSLVRRGGREPLDLGAAIGALVTERAWELPAAGATLRERWETIAPDLTGHVVAVGYELESGRLTVCPESAAWATKVRLEQARVIEAANASAGRTVGRALQILAPGSVPKPAPDDQAPQAAAAPKGPVRTRELACEGFRRALAAHQAARPEQRVNPAITEAAARQTRAMRQLSQRAFSEAEEAPDSQPPPIEAARVQRRREAEATRAAALRWARAECAQQSRAATAAPGSASLRPTA